MMTAGEAQAAAPAGAPTAAEPHLTEDEIRRWRPSGYIEETRSVIVPIDRVREIDAEHLAGREQVEALRAELRELSRKYAKAKRGAEGERGRP